MIRVIVVDADNSFRSALCKAIRQTSDIEIEAELDDVQEAVCLAADLDPDVFFLGLDVVISEHLDLIGKFVNLPLKTRLVVAAQYVEDWCIIEAFRIGIWGYVKKDREKVGELVEMIRTVSDGGTIISPRLTALIFDELCRHRRQSKATEKSRQSIR